MDTERRRHRGREDAASRHTDAVDGGDSSEALADRSRSRRSVLGAIGAVGAGVFVGRVSRPTNDRQSGGSTTEASDSGPAGRGMEVGIHDGSGADAISRVDRTESWVGPRFDIQNLFVPWDDGRYELDELFGRILPRIWHAGRTPMLTWEPHLSSGPTPDDIAGRIVAGDYDSLLDEWAGRMRVALRKAGFDSGERTDRPAAYVRLAHEANGNWYPWAPASGAGTPENYRAMWRHVHSRVESAFGYRSPLAWVWAANGVDVGPYTMEELYPGDAFVDWLGVDNYNWAESEPWSRWRSPTELFVDPIERVRAIGARGMPVGVTEFASSSAIDGGYDVSRKAAWIGEVFDVLARANVDMAVWFNQDRKTDWAVFDGTRGTDRVRGREGNYEVYPAYRDGVLWFDG